MSRKAVWLAGLAAVVVLVLPAVASAAPCTDTYKGPAEGLWQTAANWSAEHVPTSSDVACIESGSTVEASSGTNQVGVVQGEGSLVIHESTLEVTNTLEASVINTLVLHFGAVLTGAAAVDVSGSLVWSDASTMSGSGLTVVGSGASASVTASVHLVGRVLVNEGTFTYSEGSLSMDEGAQLDNSGTFKANGQGVFGITTEGKGTAPLVVNTGLFEKTAGEEATKVEVGFENSGTVKTPSGQLVFGEKPVSVTLTSSSVLEGTEVFNHATITGSSFKASGKVTVEHGSLTILEGSTASIANLTMNYESDVMGAGTLDLTETFVWNLESTMSGSGTTVVEPGATGSLHTGFMKLAERTLVNEGTLTLEGYLLLSKNARIKNVGTFDANIEGVFGITAEEKDLTGLFVNTGTFQKTKGAGETRVEVDFENEGKVDAQAGKFTFGYNPILVTLATGSTLSGEIVVNRGVVTGGNFKAAGLVVEHAFLTISTGSTATVADFTMNFESVVTGGGTLALTKTFVWNIQSAMTGSGVTVIKPGATGSLTGDTMSMSERTLINEGTFNWTGGSLSMSNRATLDNIGTFNANSESVNGIYVLTYPAPLIVNSGTFQKTEGTGETKIEEVPFENLGQFLQLTGKLFVKAPVNRDSSFQWGGENPSGPGHEGPLCGEPVDCATGDFFETQTDLAIGGRGIGLNMVRTYNSQAAIAGVSGAFGPGWSSSFSDHLVLGQGKAILHQTNGSTVPFSEGKSGSFTPPLWSQDSLRGSAKIGYSVVLANQTKYRFEGSTGRLASVSDRNNNQTKLAYNKAGQLETITDPAGRKITLTYNGEGFIETAKDPMGHTVKYTYEGGNLASVTEPGEAKARWQYHYDGSQQMTSFTDGRGGKTSNEYDGSNRVTSQTDPTERKLTFEYEPFHTKITNHSTGSVTDEHYTSSNEPYSITHGFGTASATTSTFTYDAENDLTSITDGNSHVTTYTYENGNKTSMVDPNKNETKWTYDQTHDVLTVTTPKGEKTTITRDSHGNAEMVSRPAPHSTTQTTTYHYDANGNLTSAVDPLKHTWSYEYDNKGNRTNETDPEGDKRTYGYNEDSKETSIVSPKGNVKGAEASQYTTKIERDEQGRPTTITDPLGHTVKYAYDGNGNIETVTDSDAHTTTYTYNADNQKTKVKEPSGITTETVYDGAQCVTSQTDGNKHTTTYTRNPVGEIIEIKDPLGRITKKEYDTAGNLTAVTDPAKRTTKYTYDPANNLKEITYSESKTPTVKYEYDADGNRATMTDGTGKTSYTYDLLDRLVQSTSGHGDSTGYEYDLASNQTKLTYPNKNLLTRAYDNNGRLQSVTDWSSNTTTFAYDPNSNPTTTTFPKGTSEQDKISYNNADQQIKTTMTSGLKPLAGIAYTRDGEGQLKSTTSNGVPGSENPSYTYDTNNRLEKAGSTTYAYDSGDSPTTLGANTSAYDAAGELKTSGSNIYGYDQLGNRVNTTPKGAQATIYAYNQAGNLTQVKQGKAGGLNVTYTYDGNGLRATQTKGKTTTAMTWDMHGERPLTVSDEQNSYIYGPGEIPIEEIQSKGTVLYLHHDQQGSTRMITSSTGTVEATTTYDAYGNTTGTTGTTTTPIGYDAQYTNTDTGLIYLRARSYDPTTAQFTNSDPIAPITRQPFNYTNDNPLNLTDPAGLCSINPFASSNCLTEGVETGTHFAEQHPVITGVGLGLIAVGTGGAALVAESGAAGIGLGSIAAASGLGASVLDGSECLNGDTGACIGAGLGIIGAGLGGPEFLAARGLIGEGSVFRGLATAGLLFGFSAVLADIVNHPDLLSPLLGC